MNKCMKWVKEDFLEEAGVILKLAVKAAQAFSKRKAETDIPDRREKRDKGKAQTYEQAWSGQGRG